MKDGLLKGFRTVAAIAMATKSAAVNVIASMTAKALFGERAMLIQRRPMTGVTDQFLVFTFQLIVGLCIVIEGPKHPCIGVVALATLTAETSLVYIIRLMASDTLDIRLLELPAQVTGFTSGRAVYANERETR